MSEKDCLAVLRQQNARLLAELQGFVSYYQSHGSHMLGNGEAFQHFDRARRLLVEIEGGKPGSRPPVIVDSAEFVKDAYALAEAMLKAHRR